MDFKGFTDMTFYLADFYPTNQSCFFAFINSVYLVIMHLMVSFSYERKDARRDMR